MASLDLHANVTEKMVKCATALVPYECYPHTDDHETSYEAAKLLAETLDGQLKPVMAYRRIPFLLPLFPTIYPEFFPLYDLAKELQSRPGARCVRFTHGFYASDIEEMGMCVMAITNGDQALAESIADEMAAAIDREKGGLREKYPTLDEALDHAIEPADRPYVIADTSDNPGGGGLGDTTHILRRVLERGITGGAFATIVDPAFVELCEKAGVGETVEGDLGGWSDPVYSGGPVHVTAYVRAITHGMFRNKGKMSQGNLSKFGKTAVVEIAGNVVVVVSFSKQTLDLEIYRSNGIEPADYKFLVAKSAIHFRAHYGTVAREMVAVPLPGYIAPTPENFQYKNWKGEV
jgi:microcystin degradation protein MlrC